MISIIIPTLNEEEVIAQTVQHTKAAAQGNDFEIIIVDASPSHRTKKALAGKNVRFIKSQRGRGLQMNKGSEHANGDVLCFLHADTLLPKRWDQDINQVLTKGYAGGGFLKQFTGSSVWLKGNAMLTNMRALLFHSLLGDNAMFVKKSTFAKIGGFENLPLMEDVAFSSKLKKEGMKIVRSKVTTSSRRFEHSGVVRTIMLMQWLRFLYALGFSPHRLKTMYMDRR